MNRFQALEMVEAQPEGTIAVCAAGAVWIKSGPDQWVRYTKQEHLSLPLTDRKVATLFAQMRISRYPWSLS